MDREEILSIKKKQLDELSEYREKLYKAPQLRQLFFELTLRCNSACFHCGSRCTPQSPDGLPVGEYLRVLDEVEARYGNKMTQICLTGGEPLLYGDFFELAQAIHDRGFRWGMTSNGTLISREVARKLHETGMGTISISVDGLPETHDRLRGMPGGFERTMTGVRNLIEEGGFHSIQITTVVNHQNIGELDALFEYFDSVDIDSWRVIGLEPIGRALEHPDLLLTPEDQRRLFAFIREKRLADFPVTYGCSHYLGLEWEREVRDWYFLCNAGVYVAGILSNGDIGACLDIERRPETIQGNIAEDSFVDVWENRFELFRRPLCGRSAVCRDCSAAKYCAGGSFHSWDYDMNEQKICMRGILLDEKELASPEKADSQSVSAAEAGVHGTAELRTDRMILRRYRPEDAEKLYRYFGTDPVMYKYSGWNPYATPEMAEGAVREFIDNYADEHFYGWAIEVDGALCGTIGAYDYQVGAGGCGDDRIEVGLSVARNCWGRGYATEALKAVMSYLTENEGISCVTAWCAAENIGSRRAVEKAGMKLVRTEEGGLMVGDCVYDKLVFEYVRPLG